MSGMNPHFAKQQTHNQRPMMVVGDNLNAEDTLWLFNIAMENPL